MSKDEYLITDAPLKALTVFAMPMILGSFFQQVYNMADSIIVGQFVGSSALAAVGACAALTNVFICVALGAGVGAGVLVSRYFGTKDYGKMKTIVSTSLACRPLPTFWKMQCCTCGSILQASRSCSCTTFFPPCSPLSGNPRSRWGC